jgi:high-affinity Fe2+/Pb2+ permease
MRSVTVVAAGAGHYVHWGVLSVSLSILLIVVGMVLVFALALVVPFGAGRSDDRDDRSRP